MYDEEFGYFEPRPWHQDRPQRPKVWGNDTPTNYWGPGHPHDMPGPRKKRGPPLVDRWAPPALVRVLRALAFRIPATRPLHPNPPRLPLFPRPPFPAALAS